MHVRALTVDDLVAYRELHRFGITESPLGFVDVTETDQARPDSEVAAMLERGEGWGVFKGERLVGKLTIDALPYPSLAHAFWVHAVYVHPDARGAGASAALMRAAIESAVEKGHGASSCGSTTRTRGRGASMSGWGSARLAGFQRELWSPTIIVTTCSCAGQWRPNSVWTRTDFRLISSAERRRGTNAGHRGGATMEYVDQAVAILRDGFANANNPKGILIALAATIFLNSWKQWLPITLVATVIHIAIDTLAPVLAGGGGSVTLPPLMETSFWTQTGVLFVGYAIVIGVFFLIKGMFFKGGAKAAH
jgi:GNAT superfamily N-acetyltransferase